MTPRTLCTTIVAIIACMSVPVWGQQYLLYSPQPVTSSKKPSPQEGILVKEIEIRKGDTLYGLSRKFSGHGMYYPQILLFNAISNPDLIYSGATLKIPITQNETTDSAKAQNKSAATTDKAKSSTGTSPGAGEHSSVNEPAESSAASASPFELSSNDLKNISKGKSSTANISRKNTIHAKVKPAVPSHAKPTSPLPPSIPDVAATTKVTPAADVTAGQKLFEAATKAYRQNDCRTALDLFDRYLADNSASPLAADASLYKAECYLKLSAQ